MRCHGAPAIKAGEGGAAYVARALQEGPFRRVRHGGNHVFAFPCGSTAMRRTVRARMATTLPYPLRTDAPEGWGEAAAQGFRLPSYDRLVS